MTPTIVEKSDDGIWGVIVAGDLPPGIARSKTRDDPKDALAAPWDPSLTTPVGPGSVQKYIKVKLSDLGLGSRPKIFLDPKDYTNKPGKKIISDYPHTCPVCGGKMLLLFSSQEHEGGLPCPGPRNPSIKLKKRR